MSEFTRDDGIMSCEGVSLDRLARAHGTPLFVYSRAAMLGAVEGYKRAFDGFDHIICFAAKANSNVAVLRTLAASGCGADIVSGGELHRAIGAGMPPEKIVYSGVGKTEVEMEQALSAGILMFNIESFTELSTLDSVAGRLGKKARVALRVNPDVDPRTHPYVATGLKTSKFGIRFDAVAEGYRRAEALPNISVVGVDCHIGSQLSTMGPFIEAAEKLKKLIGDLRGGGFDIRYLDMGGGLGITYDDETPPTTEEYGRAVRGVMEGMDLTLLLEPGRSIMGNAGVMLTRVLYTKLAGDKRFAIVDAGMGDLLRPSLYGSYHHVTRVDGREPRGEETTDVVGPICESGDFLARDRVMSGLKRGDLLAVMSAGAYGFSMASTYNSRPLAAEVMVNGTEHAVVRQRGDYEDLTRGEKPAPW